MSSEKILKKYTNQYGNIPLSAAENETDIYYFKNDKAAAICKKLNVSHAKVHVGFNKSGRFFNPVFNGCCVALDDVEIVKIAIAEAEQKSQDKEDKFYFKKMDVLRCLIKEYPSTPTRCIDELLFYIESIKVRSTATKKEIYNSLFSILDRCAYFVANKYQQFPQHPNKSAARKKELYEKRVEVLSLWSQPGGQAESVDLSSKNSLTSTNVFLPLVVLRGKPELVKKKIVAAVSNKLRSEGFSCICDQFLSEAVEQNEDILELASKYVQLTIEKPTEKKNEKK